MIQTAEYLLLLLLVVVVVVVVVVKFKLKKNYTKKNLAQLAAAAEYIDCISAQG